MRELSSPTQPEEGGAPTSDDAEKLKSEIDALMSLPPRPMPDIIVVGDDDVAAIYLPPRRG